MIKITQEGWAGLYQTFLNRKIIFLFHSHGNNEFRQRIFSESGIKEMPDGTIERWK